MAQVCGAVTHAAMSKPMTHYPRTLWGATSSAETLHNSASGFPRSLCRKPVRDLA
jgi:hypothetical protein